MNEGDKLDISPLSPLLMIFLSFVLYFLSCSVPLLRMTKMNHILFSDWFVKARRNGICYMAIQKHADCYMPFYPC